MTHDLKVISEGLEGIQQLEFLMAHGCDEAERFLFGRHLPVRVRDEEDYHSRR